MGLRNKNTKSRKEEAREMAQIQDSFNTGQLEQQMAMKKNQEQGEEENLLSVREAKADLRKALLGKELRIKQVKTEGGDIKQQPVWIDISEKELCNQKGFDMVWSEIEGFLNKNVTSSYLPAHTIENMCKGTLKTVIKQVKTHREEYGIENREDASQIVNIVRTALIANMNKSRGGRALQSKEKTVVEKITRALDSDTEQENSAGAFGGVFN